MEAEDLIDRLYGLVAGESHRAGCAFSTSTETWQTTCSCGKDSAMTAIGQAWQALERLGLVREGTRP
jgi:hypothetical protein